MRLNINRLFEHSKTRGIAIIVLVVIGTVVLWLMLNGKHNKISASGIETNIPKVDSPQKKSLTVTGDNNNVIQGNNNSIVVSSEPKLTESIKNDVIIKIEQIRKDSNFVNKNICMGETSNSNAKKMSLELEDFLIKKGYQIEQPHGTIHERIEKYSIFLYRKQCVVIWLGVF